MPSLNDFYARVKTYQTDHRILYFGSLMIFFWAMFDGIVSYVTPLVITERGLSKTAMGLIYASSSVAGALFDFLLSKFLKSTHYRRLFFIMFVICFGYPLLLWKAQTVFMFVLAMAIWGLYYDFKNFGSFDFISRHSKKEEHSSNFGVLGIFQSLGYLIAPILAGILIGGLVGTRPFIAAFLFLVISFLFYLILFKSAKTQGVKIPEEKIFKPINAMVELHLWKKIGKILLPVLFFILILYVYDAVFWTIGPLYSENFASFSGFGGLFMAMYTLPMLLTGWFVGSLTKRFGKKKTAFFSFLISSFFLLSLPFLKNPYLVLVTVFVSSMIGSFAWPAIKGAFVDYITESSKYEKEIEGLVDFFTNIGYVIGPMFAGFLSDKVGNGGAFSALGVLGITTTLILIFTTPRKIKVVVGN